jgi:hypothetical protein
MAGPEFKLRSLLNEEFLEYAPYLTGRPDKDLQALKLL